MEQKRHAAVPDGRRYKRDSPFLNSSMVQNTLQAYPFPTQTMYVATHHIARRYCLFVVRFHCWGGNLRGGHVTLTNEVQKTAWHGLQSIGVSRVQLL